MKWTAILIALALFLLTVSVALADPEDYDLSWNTVGGGGKWSGGDYTLAGTAGQPDAAIWQGGEYTLVGGFWGGARADYSTNIYLPLTLKKS